MHGMCLRRQPIEPHPAAIEGNERERRPAAHRQSGEIRDLSKMASIISAVGTETATNDTAARIRIMTLAVKPEAASANGARIPRRKRDMARSARVG